MRSWIEIDSAQLRRNLQILRHDMPSNLNWYSVVKDQAYGHGVEAIAKETLAYGAKKLAVANIDEALQLKQLFPNASILIFGERTTEESKFCIENKFEFFVNDALQATRLNEIALKKNKTAIIHMEVDSGMSRYGVRWTNALVAFQQIAQMPNLQIATVMTHFAMSDESDKTFACQQFSRFMECIDQFRASEHFSRHDIQFHACNTGGYLDLPQAHLDLVRIGILPLGVYPSQVCRRIMGIKPILSMKTRVAAIKGLEVGDSVGYGMHYKATSKRQIAVLPIGYGSGYPRLRNKGHVLIGGKFCAIVGGNAMNATMIDITDQPSVQPNDEVVLIGSQQEKKISIHDLAGWCGTVSYEMMTRLNIALPRVIVE